MQQDELNLEHTVITSPVDGTVVARDVSVGPDRRRVAADADTFLDRTEPIARWKSTSTSASRTSATSSRRFGRRSRCSRYPNATFHGTVSQVRINPQTLNNVVTYDVVVYAENAGGQLLPGMTANATIDVASARTL